MLKLHHFTKDAALTVLYIGAVAALVAASLTLLVLFSLSVEFTDTHWMTAVVAALGWIGLPFAPRFYRAKTGHGFFFSGAFGAQEF